MPSSSNTSSQPAAEGPAAEEAAADRDQQHRERAKAHAALLGETAGKVAVELPMSADVDDFRRVLAAAAKPGAKP